MLPGPGLSFADWLVSVGYYVVEQNGSQHVTNVPPSAQDGGPADNDGSGSVGNAVNPFSELCDVVQAERNQYTIGAVSACTIIATEAALQMINGTKPSVAVVDACLVGSSHSLAHVSLVAQRPPLVRTWAPPTSPMNISASTKSSP